MSYSSDCLSCGDFSDNALIFSGVIGGTIGLVLSVETCTENPTSDSNFDVCVDASSGTGDFGSECTDAMGLGYAIAIGASAVGGAMSATQTSSNDAGPFDGVIILFRKDSVPYNRIAHKADAVYCSLHGDRSGQTAKGACISAASAETADALRKFVGIGSKDEAVARLKLLKKALLES